LLVFIGHEVRKNKSSAGLVIKTYNTIFN